MCVCGESVCTACVSTGHDVNTSPVPVPSSLQRATIMNFRAKQSVRKKKGEENDASNFSIIVLFVNQ